MASPSAGGFPTQPDDEFTTTAAELTPPAAPARAGAAGIPPPSRTHRPTSPALAVR
jgi:hypothetical protein